MKVIPTDVYDKDGNMLRIEFHNLNGEFEFQVVWDDQDPQDSEHRENLRKWAYKMAKQLNFEVAK